MCLWANYYLNWGDYLWHWERWCGRNIINNRCFPVKNASSVVSCTCKFILLLLAVFYMVTAGRKFNFTFATCVNNKPNRRPPVESGRRSARGLRFWPDLYAFFTRLARRLRPLLAQSRSKLLSSFEDISCSSTAMPVSDLNYQHTKDTQK
jgi:hypothetical protein